MREANSSYPGNYFVLLEKKNSSCEFDTACSFSIQLSLEAICACLCIFKQPFLLFSIFYNTTRLMDVVCNIYVSTGGREFEVQQGIKKNR